MTQASKIFFWKLMNWTSPFMQSKVSLILFGELIDSKTLQDTDERLSAFIQGTDNTTTPDSFVEELQTYCNHFNFGVDDLSGRPFLIL